MVKEVKMPNLGTTSDEIRIVRWLKQEGDNVQRGEPLLEVETDKAVMEVESYLSGTLIKTLVSADDLVNEGDTIAMIGDKEERPVIRVSPIVKSLAEELGVDLSTVTGTGLNGMILREDVKAAAKNKAEPLSTRTQDITLEEESVKEVQATELQPFNTVQKLTARSMSESKSTIPHVYYAADCDPQQMINTRKSQDKKFSYNAFIIKAVAIAIGEFPRAAAAYTPEGIRLPAEINIGLAVDIDGDLVVPVVKQANTKTVFEIQENLDSLIKKARSKTLHPGDLAGGIFTVSSLGSAGIDSFFAVIKPGESGILAVGRMREEPVVSGSAVIPGQRMRLSLSQDHRVVNGAYSTAFLMKIKEAIEECKI